MSGMLKTKPWTAFIISGMLGISLFFCHDYGHCEHRIEHTKLIGEKPLHPGYPLMFDIRGKIDRLSKNEIVVDDSLLRLSDNVKYHIKKGRFKEGDLIGLKLNPDGKVASIWLIKAK